MTHNAHFEGRSSAAASHMLFGSPELTNIAIAYDRNAEIYGEGEPAEYVYKVISGAVRSYKVLNDGRRQINAFYLPGDIFGLELGDEHTWSAEAVAGCMIAMVKRRLVLGVAERDADVAWLRTISRMNPLTYEVDALRTLMLRGGASAYGLWLDFGVMLAVTALLTILAAKLYGRMGY